MANATADSLYQQSKQHMNNHVWQEAVELLSSASLEPLKDWRLFWNLGWSRYQLSAYEPAMRDFLSALKFAQTDEHRATALTFAGMAALSAAQWQSAINYLTQAVVLTDTTLARKYLAMAHREGGDGVAAEKVHTSGLKKQPNNLERLAAYGDFLLDQGRVEEAMEVKDQIHKLSPDQ